MTYFADFTDFLTMNGYAVYVWPVWGLIVGMLLIYALFSRRERQRVLADIRRQERRESAQHIDAE